MRSYATVIKEPCNCIFCYCWSVSHAISLLFALHRQWSKRQGSRRKYFWFKVIGSNSLRQFVRASPAIDNICYRGVAEQGADEFGRFTSKAPHHGLEQLYTCVMSKATTPFLKTKTTWTRNVVQKWTVDSHLYIYIWNIEGLFFNFQKWTFFPYYPCFSGFAPIFQKTLKWPSLFFAPTLLMTPQPSQTAKKTKLTLSMNIDIARGIRTRAQFSSLIKKHKMGCCTMTRIRKKHQGSS